MTMAVVWLVVLAVERLIAVTRPMDDPNRSSQ